MPSPWASEAEVLALARGRHYLELSFVLERIIRHLNGASSKRAFASVKRIIDKAGLDGVDIMVRSQLILLRRMRDQAQHIVTGLIDTLGDVYTRAGDGALDVASLEQDLVRFREHRDKMDAEIERLLSDHPHLRDQGERSKRR